MKGDDDASSSDFVHVVITLGMMIVFPPAAEDVLLAPNTFHGVGLGGTVLDSMWCMSIMHTPSLTYRHPNP